MFALALLLVVDPPPASVRLEVKEIVVAGDAAPIVNTVSLEAAVAADGWVFGRVAEGERTRTLKAKVERSGDRWLIQASYRKTSLDCWVPVPGGRKRIDSVIQTDESFLIDAVGRPFVLDRPSWVKQLDEGRWERCTLRLSYTLLPAFGATATLEPVVLHSEVDAEIPPKP